MLLPNRPVLTDNPLTSWMNKTVQTLHDLSADVQPEDTPLTLDNLSMIWRGNYDTSCSYNVGDVVRVVSRSFYTVGGLQLTSSIGMYVCVNTVPSDYSYTHITGVDSYVSTFLDQLTRQRNDNICYCPIIPEPAVAVVDTTPNEQGRYWEAVELISQPSGSPINWMGEWSSTTTYQSGDVTRVSTNPANPVAGKCYTGIFCANRVNTNSQPIFPEPEVYVSGSLQTPNWSIWSMGIKEINVANFVSGSMKMLVQGNDIYSAGY
jgi:hypothetical protein